MENKQIPSIEAILTKFFWGLPEGSNIELIKALKQREAQILNTFLEWRLNKPHSDFQTRKHDIKDFLKDLEDGQ